MCGINGFNFKDNSLAMRMRKFTKSRGPDADGIYIDNFFTILHDRLSILDLSSSANQPMTFENLVISYNGEIYNFENLKKELIDFGYQFKTNCDTEVILYLFHKYNVDAFKKLSGIFALAIWDKLNRKLYLVRDKVRVKPLYYHFNSYEKKFHFSSSVKSLLECSKSKILNEDAVHHYSNFGRNDLKETIFKNIYKDLEKYYKNMKRYNKNDLKFNHCNDFELKNRLNHVCFLDIDSVIPNDFLLRNDKIFMSQGKEVRVPMLDVNLINKFLMMNESKKFVNSFKSKNLLKKVFNKEIHSLVKGKWGLQSPYAKWLKGPLNTFAKEILSKEYYSNSDKYLNFENIQKMLIKHQKEYYNPALIWSLINLQLFFRKFKL